MRIKCIACDVLARLVYLSAAYSPNIIDVSLERFGLHQTPQKLRDVLQRQIDSANSEGGYDAVVLAYGLCGKSTHMLKTGTIPLIIPRAHDCITLFLGGRARYEDEFSTCPGTYWYVKDYIERGDTEDVSLSIGAHTAEDADVRYLEFVEKYGADNANYLMDVMDAWQNHYERAVFIDHGVGDGKAVAKRAQADAQQRGWRFEHLEGDAVLIKRLLDGDWNEDFLILQPGQQIEMVGGDEIVRGSSLS